MNKEKYKAQALAIAMVVLVVSSILAMSIYSRVSKDKALSLDERSSAEALEVSDLILNYLTAKPIKDVIAAVSLTEYGGQSINDPTGITLIQNSSKNEIHDLIVNKLQVTANLNDLSICPTTVGDNSYSLNIRKADINTYFEIRPSQIIAIPIKGIDLGSDCDKTKIKVAVAGEKGAGFSITNTYGKDYAEGIATSYKPYDELDVTNYCFASSTECNNPNFLNKENWIPFKDDNSESITVNLKAISGEYKLDEIKITAIGGTIGIAYEILPSCTDKLNMINVQVGANCSGTYRGKFILIPEKQWEIPIFNYVLFNGEGSI